MAAPKKKTTKASSKAKPSPKKAAPKKSTAPKAKKKATAVKKSTAKARKTSTTSKRVRKPAAEKATTKAVKKTTSKKTPSTTAKKSQKVSKPRSWWSVLTFGVVAIGIAVGGYLAANPVLLAQLQANLLAQETGEEEVVVSEAPEGGVLIAWELGGENELKLQDIFETVFPETSLEVVAYDSEEGKELVQKHHVTEVPAVFYEQSAFEKETLSEVVNDLFSLKEGYYALNVSLVNPSYQWHIGGSINTDGAMMVGDEEAPVTIVVYSDPKCQHCRVDAQNNLDQWQALVEEGMVNIHFMDLPQSTESYTHAVAMQCVGQKTPEEYMAFRKDLFTKANLTKSYTTRILTRMGIDYEKDCNESEIQSQLRRRIKTAENDGITGVPAMYMQRSGEEVAVRITGAKDFAEYQSVLTNLMGIEEQQETPVGEESTETIEPNQG